MKAPQEEEDGSPVTTVVEEKIQSYGGLLVSVFKAQARIGELSAHIQKLMDVPDTEKIDAPSVAYARDAVAELRRYIDQVSRSVMTEMAAPGEN